MKNIFLLFSFMTLCLLGGWAQNAKPVKEKFMKLGNVDAVSITLTGFPKNVEDVLEAKFKKETGQKPKSKSGLKIYSGVYYKSIANKTLDIYYQVEKEGTKEAPMSRIDLFLSLGNESFLDPKKYPDEVKAAMAMLEEIPKEVYEFEMELAIEEQLKVIQKTMKEYEKLGTDSTTLEIKRVETLQAIEQNLLDREQQRIQISEDEEAMAELKALLESSRKGEGAAIRKIAE